QDDSMGKDQLDGTQNAMKFYGKELAAVEGFRRGTVDFSSQVMAMRDAKCKYVLTSTMIRATSQILNQAQKIGYKTQFIGNGSTPNVKIAELSGKASDGYMAASAWEMLNSTVPGMEKVRAVMKKYSGDKFATNDHYLMGWIYSKIFTEGIKLAGRDLTVDSFVKGMERIKDLDMGGVMGNVTFSSKRHIGCIATKLVKFDLKKKQFIPLDKEPVEAKSPQFAQ
ncbi:MAG: ABC transporter substrate-binding protein, partial [Thermodesulfobacteriota bacterium]|nr:ABC transporter substrate-binding protein [Thermodesulfobacteriota bacterium]